MVWCLSYGRWFLQLHVECFAVFLDSVQVQLSYWQPTTNCDSPTRQGVNTAEPSGRQSFVAAADSRQPRLTHISCCCCCCCREMTANEPGHAPDVVIEAVGFHYCKSWLHAIEVGRCSLSPEPQAA